MNQPLFLSPIQVAFRLLSRLGILFLLSWHAFSAALPLPDTIQFAETAKLPVGVQDRTLACSIVSENDNVLVVETSTVPGVSSRFSIDKLLISEIKRGDSSARPFADLAPDLALPPESMDAAYYDDKIDRIFEPFLKKYPQSSYVPEVKDAEKAYGDEAQRVAGGEFRTGSSWVRGTTLSPIDLKAFQLIQQARRSGATQAIGDFKQMAEEARKCFASQFFPVLGTVLEEISGARIAKLKTDAAVDPDKKDPAAEDRIKEELLALQPISGWDWTGLKKAVDLVWKTEDLLKTEPPEQISIPIDLTVQSRQLMPSLLARDRVLREQSNVYAAKGAEASKAGDRPLALAWWHAALMLANEISPPENHEMSDALLTSFQKSFTEESAVMMEKRQYPQAKAWFEAMVEFMTKTPAAASRVKEVEKNFADFQIYLTKQLNQQPIDNLRKKLAEDLVRNDFEDARIALSSQWETIEKLNPTPAEIVILAHAALDQAEAAFKALKPVPGCQLIVLAHRISPDNPRVKTWVLGASMTAFALFLALLFPIFWIFGYGGVILENLRYRYRLKGLRKTADKKAKPRRKK